MSGEHCRVCGCSAMVLQRRTIGGRLVPVCPFCILRLGLVR